MPQPGRVVVRIEGRAVADTRVALRLAEASYPAVLYIPRADAEMLLFVRSDHQSYCPYKGECSYFSIPWAGPRGRNLAWSYEAPYPPVAAIKGYLAFYSDRAQVELKQPL